MKTPESSTCHRSVGVRKHRLMSAVPWQTRLVFAGPQHQARFSMQETTTRTWLSFFRSSGGPSRHKTREGSEEVGGAAGPRSACLFRGKREKEACDAFGRRVRQCLLSVLRGTYQTARGICYIFELTCRHRAGCLLPG